MITVFPTTVFDGIKSIFFGRSDLIPTLNSKAIKVWGGRIKKLFYSNRKGAKLLVRNTKRYIRLMLENKMMGLRPESPKNGNGQDQNGPNLSWVGGIPVDKTGGGCFDMFETNINANKI